MTFVVKTINCHHLERRLVKNPQATDMRDAYGFNVGLLIY